jgi:hypothetical protein
MDKGVNEAFRKRRAARPRKNNCGEYPVGACGGMPWKLYFCGH